MDQPGERGRHRGDHEACRSINERDAFNEVYKKYWEPGKFPARHAFGVTGLYLGARVEIACVAVVK
ncbi:MAG: RidA family protein [Actinomycetota bacterium]|nr:RidA family protein [Actinomycetota bacterium]